MGKQKIDLAKHINRNSPDENDNQSITIEEYSDSLTLLENKYPDKILFSMKEVSIILNVSYEFIRINCLNGKIPVKNFGKRKMIHLFELARLIKAGLT